MTFAFSFNDLFTGIFKISDEPVKNKITNLEPPIKTNKPNPIEPEETVYFNFNFIGWHYISIPLVSGNREIRGYLCNSSTVTPGNEGQCTNVYFYNSTEQQWKNWDIGVSDSLNTLKKADSGYGYWVNVNDTGSMNGLFGPVINPYQDIALDDLQPGWNSMGFTEWNVDYRMDVLIQNISDIWGKNITRVWNYSLNTDMIEPAYPNDPNAEFKINWDTGYNYGYWTCVSVPGDNDYCARSEPPLMPWQNQRPVLANNTVSPSSGDETTTFTFSVNYTDADSDLPTLKKVVIDGTPYELTLNSGLYKYSTTLTAGSHDYYFNFSDGTAHTYYDGTNTRKTEIKTLNVDLPPMQPTALILTNTTEGKVPLTVEFNGLTSIDPDGSISLYEWDFNNDGITDSTNSIETHTFNTVGTFVVNLTVTDNDGMKDNDSITIIVNPDQSPTANFNYICNYLQCIFTDTSTDTDGTITNYKWDFQNDGTTDSVLKNPTFTYSADGTYTVNLTVTDNYGNKNNITKQVTVADYINQKPTADFTYNCNKLDCTFTDASTDADGSVVSWNWKFNDSGTSALKNPTHTFASAGIYNVSLTVADNNTETDSAIISIAVSENLYPTAVILADITSGKAPLAVEFSAKNSSDIDGTIVSYEWDFNDDGTTDSTNNVETYVFNTAGTFTVTLTVTDNNGGTDTDTIIISTTANARPTAKFTKMQEPYESNAVFFFGNSSFDADGSIIQWKWDFGDGTVSAVQNPIHVYNTIGYKNGVKNATTGYFFIKLSVKDNNGQWDNIGGVVAVKNQPPVPVLNVQTVNNVIKINSSASYDNVGKIKERYIVVKWFDRMGRENGKSFYNEEYVEIEKRGSAKGYTVKLILIDDNGAQTEIQQAVASSNDADILTLNKNTEITSVSDKTIASTRKTTQVNRDDAITVRRTTRKTGTPTPSKG